MLLILAVVSGIVLRQVQNYIETRPCPRCGARLEIGDTSCECGYDFDNERERGSTQ